MSTRPSKQEKKTVFIRRSAEEGRQLYTVGMGGDGSVGTEINRDATWSESRQNEKRTSWTYRGMSRPASGLLSFNCAARRDEAAG